MYISLNDLQIAGKKSDITDQQIAKLWDNLQEQYENRPRFIGIHVAYYFGGLLIMLAMTIFVNEKWDALGHAGVLAVFSFYAVIFFLAGKALWQKSDTKIPGGILLTFTICLVPLITYKIMLLLNIWPDVKTINYQDFHIVIRKCWLILEFITIVVGLIFVKYFRFPLMMLPIIFCFWLLSMDLTYFLYGKEFLLKQIDTISMYFGLLILCGSYLIDKRTKEDFAFWGYLFGTLAFWGGMTLLLGATELSKFFYACINLFMIVVSVILQRKIFIVCGSVGFLGYLFHLASILFKDIITLSLILTMAGVLCIYFVIKYNKHQKIIEEFIINKIPKYLRDDLPINR